MSRYGITDFYNTAAQYSFARTNLFRITEITNGLYTPSESEDLFLYMRTSSIPQRKITVNEVKFRNFTYNVPSKATYPDAVGNWQVEFFCDKDYVLKDIFEKWSVNTFDEHSSTAQNTQWWDTNIVLSLLNNSSTDNSLTELTPIKQYTLVGAFPSTIAQVQYDISKKGEIATLQVNLGFQYFISETLN